MLAKKILYKILPFETYLKVLSKLYFISFRNGLLRGRAAFDYPYFLPHLVDKDDTVIDIGANLGYYSVLFAEILTQGKLYSVEPVSEMRKVLTLNLRKFKNVTIYPYALGAEDKEIIMGNDSVAQQGYVGTGVNMVLDANTGVDHAAMEFHTQMRRGSELFGQLDKIDFIKCDIEGYEVVALGEMKDLIAKHRPTVLLETGGEQRAIMVDMFEGMGYKCFVLRGTKLHHLELNMGEDILFIHDDRMEKFKLLIDEN